MRDVRSRPAAQGERQRRREPHPPVAQRRPQVRDPGAAHHVDVRSTRWALADLAGASSSAPRRRGPARRGAARARAAPRPAHRKRGQASTPGSRRGSGAGAPRPRPYARGVLRGAARTLYLAALARCPAPDPRPEPVLLAGDRGDGAALAQLCEALAVDYDVTVVTGHLHGHALPAEEERNGVQIVRVRSTAYDRSQLHHRAANYASYLGDTVLTALRGARPDLVLCMTDPPVVGDIGLLVAKRFGVPLLVISQDVFPEIAERVKRLEQPLVLGALPSTRRAVPPACRPRRRDRPDDEAATRGERRSGRADRRHPELGRHDRARPAASPQRVVGGAGPRRLLRRDALRQRRPRAGSRHPRTGRDVPARPRPAPDRPDRVRRAAR